MSNTYTPYECPISRQIAQIEDVITGLNNRIRGLEDLLDSPNLKLEQRELMENELIEIKDILRQNKDALKSLHKQNTKSFMVVGCIIFLCFFTYGVYCIMYNSY